MEKKIIYLDNGATTMVDPKVEEIMRKYEMEYYGNPASTHAMGEKANTAVEKARETIAKTINAKPSEIYFTSGGTEANNWAIKGVAYKNRKKGNHLITSTVEHKSVLNTCKWLEEEEFKTSYIKVDQEGFIDIEQLKRELRKEDGKKTILLSLIHGNNEIGTIQDINEIGKMCREEGIYFHIDACQSYTKTKIDVRKQNIGLMSLNAHKIHGPKGVGALYIQEGVEIIPWQHGGGQEKGMRAGTLNVHGIAGFAEAAKIGMDEKHVQHMARLRDKLIDGMLEMQGVRLNGPAGDKPGDRRLCNNTNFSFKGIEGEAIGGYLDLAGICSSTGSACSARTLEPSYVLKAIGLTDEEANGSLRLTLSRFTAEEDIDYVLETMPGIVKKLRIISPFGKVIDNVFKKGN